jgi:hypothetical protein
MRKKYMVMVMMFVLVFAVFADYVSIYGVTSWSRIDSHTIILYRGSTAVAKVEVRYAFIYSTSTIKFTKDYIGPWDEIIIDGESCDITDVKRL